MLPVFALVWAVAGVFTFAALGWFGLHEGDVVLMAHSVGAWALDVVVWAVTLSPAVAGVVLGVMAVRRGARWAARAAVAVNALLVLVAVYGIVDEIHMAHFPGASWLWF